ncbi:MAG: hypothetical protein HIU91_09945 [Acidobacteria bacterium]|nr:hypothetical protein [Acidobacteriota bacterium]
MTWLRTIFREIYGLFVDDGTFALLILLWLAISVFLIPYLGWIPRWRGPLLFAGLATILIASAIRYARRTPR